MGKVVQADRRTWADGEAHESVVRLGSGTNLSQSEGEGRGRSWEGQSRAWGLWCSIGACGSRGGLGGDQRCPLLRRPGSGVEAGSGGAQVKAVRGKRLLLFPRLETKVAQARVRQWGWREWAGPRRT